MRRIWSFSLVTRELVAYIHVGLKILKYKIFVFLLAEPADILGGYWTHGAGLHRGSGMAHKGDPSLFNHFEHDMA